MSEIVNFFVHWLGNWVIIAMVFCLYMLVTRTFMKKFYYGLFNSIHFKMPYIHFGFVTVFTICLREIIAIPFWKVQGWLPNSFVWEQTIFYLYTTHLPSIVLYSLMIMLFWKKFDSVVPALYTGFFVIGLIEFTFIPQHLVAFQTFLGINWYSQFGVLVFPFLIERKSFTVRNWKLMGFFLGIGLVLQYVILPFIPFSLSMYDRSVNAFRINYDLLPHPPLGTWVFCFLQTGIKSAFIIGLSFIRFVKRAEP